MSTAEYNATRQDLIQWISSLNDASMLNLLNSIRMSRKKPDQDWWDELSDHEINNIRQGLKDINDGKTYSTVEFWNKLRNE